MRPRPASHESGFSLLEVLVALVVLSLGILGVSGLITVSLKNGHSAMLRAQAAQYAYDMLDRMRVNRSAALTGKYDLVMASPPPTGSTLADKDRAGWLKALAVLPEGDGEIEVGDDGKARVKVQWSEAAFGGGLDQLELSTEL
ncbi:MAG: type IV pilus modification protein PilV [Thiobacillaceae bacterium]